MTKEHNETALDSETAAKESARERARRLGRHHVILTPGVVRGFISVIVFFIIWHLGANSEIPGVRLIPSPFEVINHFVVHYFGSAEYWENWFSSFVRVFNGFIIAQFVGIPLGIMFGLHRRFREIVYPIFEILRPVPPLAWVPLSILFWPTNESSIVFITFLGAFFVIVINVYEAIRHIPDQYLWLASSLGAKPRHTFFSIIVPAVIPSIAAGMTLGIALTWEVVIAAEMISSDTGLGRLTWEGYVSSTPAVVVIGMISIGLAGYVSTQIVAAAEKRMMPWTRDR
ncbi:MAG: ABC transporter permease [Hyphomicrobiaceae bacterium]